LGIGEEAADLAGDLGIGEVVEVIEEDVVATVVVVVAAVVVDAVLVEVVVTRTIQHLGYR